MPSAAKLGSERLIVPPGQSAQFSTFINRYIRGIQAKGSVENPLLDPMIDSASNLQTIASNAKPLFNIEKEKQDVQSLFTDESKPAKRPRTTAVPVSSRLSATAARSRSSDSNDRSKQRTPQKRSGRARAIDDAGENRAAGSNRWR